MTVIHAWGMTMSFVIALRSLRRAPLRSALTALGMIIGVAAVIATSSIGDGAQARLEEVMLLPESRTVHLSAAPRIVAGELVAGELRPNDRLNLEDYYAIRESVPYVSSVSPRVFVVNATVRADGRQRRVLAEGLDAEGFTATQRRILRGHTFGSRDVRQVGNVCVLSKSLAQTLFPDGKDLGRIVQLAYQPFTVLGVVDDSTSYSTAALSSTDFRVYIPYTSLLRRIDRGAQITISVQATDVELVEHVRDRIRDIMEQRRFGRTSDFRTSTAFESIRMHAEGSSTMANLLAAIGAVSLLVGGVGIMNIMLASVAERTREIGIRMAAGSRNGNLLAQFLMESSVLSTLGGIVGIGAGCAAAWILTRMNGWPTSITARSIMVSFVVSTAIGIIFGLHPARRAVEMHPVDALRSEP